MDGWKRTICCDFKRIDINGQPLKKNLGEQKFVIFFFFYLT
jgi:hypothetical protein